MEGTRKKKRFRESLIDRAGDAEECGAVGDPLHFVADAGLGEARVAPVGAARQAEIFRVLGAPRLLLTLLTRDHTRDGHPEGWILTSP